MAISVRQRQAFAAQMARAKAFYQDGVWDQAFYHLENAHVLGQRSIRRHALSHWWMLKVGWRQRRWGEVASQLPRLMASLVVSRVWVPPGNTGGSNVSPFQAMPLRKELRQDMEWQD
ncbi:DUF3703 domain-containing protein [Ferrimonas balearica]|uniref:DUF3703 domain-containing protein n=1 Tax=Ferrimonas balearica TaxID=44012 RepID=UPI001C99482B|nr:DUF3703 domain-containing protein [Ferrimonas balearica]MBY5993919.1 DUF3703 domain-containing protein [Ferrimonas balearica]